MMILYYLQTDNGSILMQDLHRKFPLMIGDIIKESLIENIRVLVKNDTVELFLKKVSVCKLCSVVGYYNNFLRQVGENVLCQKCIKEIQGAYHQKIEVHNG